MASVRSCGQRSWTRPSAPARRGFVAVDRRRPDRQCGRLRAARPDQAVRLVPSRRPVGGIGSTAGRLDPVVPARPRRGAHEHRVGLPVHRRLRHGGHLRHPSMVAALPGSEAEGGRANRDRPARRGGRAGCRRERPHPRRPGRRGWALRLPEPPAAADHDLHHRVDEVGRRRRRRRHGGDGIDAGVRPSRRAASTDGPAQPARRSRRGAGTRRARGVLLGRWHPGRRVRARRARPSRGRWGDVSRALAHGGVRRLIRRRGMAARAGRRSGPTRRGRHHRLARGAAAREPPRPTPIPAQRAGWSRPVGVRRPPLHRLQPRRPRCPRVRARLAARLGHRQQRGAARAAAIRRAPRTARRAGRTVATRTARGRRRARSSSRCRRLPSWTVASWWRWAALLGALGLVLEIVLVGIPVAMVAIGNWMQGGADAARASWIGLARGGGRRRDDLATGPQASRQPTPVPAARVGRRCSSSSPPSFGAARWRPTPRQGAGCSGRRWCGRS